MGAKNCAFWSIRMKRDEVVVGVLLFLFGALTSGLSLNLKLGTLTAIGTGFFPLALGILLMILSSIYLAQIILPLRKVSSKESPQDSAGSARVSCAEKMPLFSKLGQPTVNVIVTLGSMIFFALFLDTLGYSLCVFLLLVVLMRTLGLKNWAILLTLAIMATIGSWLLFIKLLKIPLPQGLVGF